VKNRRTHALYSLFTLAIKELALVAAALWVLPRFGIVLAPWLLCLIGAAIAAYSVFNFRTDRRILGKPPEVGFETMIGTVGVATSPLAPTGHVRIGGELWKATSTTGNIDTGARVVVKRTRGLTLFVSPANEASTAAFYSRPE
jgi:membrane protein implicated in regulation of membrane protease activity